MKLRIPLFLELTTLHAKAGNNVVVSTVYASKAIVFQDLHSYTAPTESND